MKWLRALIVTALCLVPVGAGAWWQSVAQQSVGAAPTYQGPGDIVTFTAWGSCSFAYTAAVAAATGNMCDLVAITGGATVCTLKSGTDGKADITTSYCGGTTVPLACAAASGAKCVISKLYDQTGGLNDWTNATLAQMPTLTFSAIGTNPALTCVAANSQSLTSPSITLSLPYSANLVADHLTGNPVITGKMWSHNTANTSVGWATGADTLTMAAGGNSVSGTATFNAGHAIQSIFTASGTSTLLVDGLSVGTFTGAGTAGAAASVVCNASTVLGGNYHIGEVGPNTQSTYNSALRANVLTRWGF